VESSRKTSFAARTRSLVANRTSTRPSGAASFARCRLSESSHLCPRHPRLSMSRERGKGASSGFLGPPGGLAKATSRPPAEVTVTKSRTTARQTALPVPSSLHGRWQEVRLMTSRTSPGRHSTCPSPLRDSNRKGGRRGTTCHRTAGRLRTPVPDASCHHLPVCRWPGQGRPSEGGVMLRERAFVSCTTAMVRAAIMGVTSR